LYAANTLFIVGAGASYELGLPTGLSLRANIARHLDVTKVSLGVDSRGLLDRPANEEIYKHLYGRNIPLVDTRYSSPELDELKKQTSIWAQIRHGIHFASSIDNFLHNRQTEEELVRVGKAIICWEIALRERNLPLPGDEQSLDGFTSERWLQTFRQKSDEEARTIAWTSYFSEQCFAGVVQESIKNALGRVKFIVFNYDRCVEQFLQISLRAIFGLNQKASGQFASSVEVIHPYGSLGDLYGSNYPAMVPFGSVPSNMATGGPIKTFSEGLKEERSRGAIAGCIGWADKIVFLGFGFHSQNMQLLTHKAKPSVSVVGTSLGLSSVATEEARKRVNFAFTGKQLFGPKTKIEFKPLTCAELLAQESVRLIE
jgi:hypothetical protein